MHRLGDSPKRIAVVRALPGLGDMLCVVPALRALRVALPRAHVTLVGVAQAEGFVERFRSYVDELLVVPAFPGLVPGTESDHARHVPAFLTVARRRQFDLALQMHGSGVTSNPFTVLLGARINAGCYLPGQYCPDETRFLPWPAHEPEVWRWLRLLEFLGVTLDGDHLEFPITDEDEQALDAIGTDQLRPGAYVCIHPGAKALDRRWPPERFAAVADALAADGLHVVLTGAAEEAHVTAAVARAMQAPTLDLTGRTSLGALAVLLRDARLMICNDTGVSHLAAALRTPSVVVFLASDPNRWAPLDRERHRIVGAPPMRDGCRHCTCIDGHRCLRDGCTSVVRSKAHSGETQVTPEHVLAEVEDLLQRGRTPHPVSRLERRSVQ